MTPCRGAFYFDLLGNLTHDPLWALSLDALNPHPDANVVLLMPEMSKGSVCNLYIIKEMESAVWLSKLSHLYCPAQCRSSWIPHFLPVR